MGAVTHFPIGSSLGPTSRDTQPMTLGCPDIKITASHAYTSTGSWSWTHSHSAQVSLLPYKPFKLVLFHVPAISPGAVVLRDVERKEKVSWHGSLGWFTNQHAAWH